MNDSILPFSRYLVQLDPNPDARWPHEDTRSLGVVAHTPSYAAIKALVSAGVEKDVRQMHHCRVCMAEHMPPLVVFAFDLLFEPTPGKVTIPAEGTALNPEECVGV